MSMSRRPLDAKAKINNVERQVGNGNTRCPARVALLEALLKTRGHGKPFASTIASLLLFSEPHPQPSSAVHSKAQLMGKHHLASTSNPAIHSSQHNYTILYIAALKSAIQSLNDLEMELRISQNDIDNSIRYRELCEVLQDIGHLLAISPSPTLAYSMLDVNYLLILSTHILAACESWRDGPDLKTVLEATTCLYGAILSSYPGIMALASSFEDSRLERNWLLCFFGDVAMDYSLVSELRRRPGAMAIAEHVQKCSTDITVSPTPLFGKVDLGIAVVTLLEAWRSSRQILQHELHELEICDSPELINRSCLDLARLCAYDSGREAVCSTLLESPLPLFFNVLENHSTSHVAGEAIRYLKVQILQTGLHYYSILSPVAEGILTELFNHIEHTALFRSFTFPNSSSLPLHIDIILEALDHPFLLWTDVNFSYQLHTVLVAIESMCAGSGGCIRLIAVLSERSLPYSGPALFAALLDEITNAISILNGGDEPNPTSLQYSKPPFHLPPLDAALPVSQNLKQSETILFLFRSSACLCDVLLRILRHRDHIDSTPDTLPSDEVLLRYVTKSCIRSMNICRNPSRVPPVLAYRLEISALGVLCHLFSIGFPSEISSKSLPKQKNMELILAEILSEGQSSPRDLTLSSNILGFLMTNWKSKEIIANNRFLGSAHKSLRKLLPELGEWLSMWDGDVRYIQWLLQSGPEVLSLVWGELLSRAELWLMKRHYKYTYRCLNSMHRLLARCRDRSTELTTLEAVLRERQLADSFQEWLQGVSEEIPETEIECSEELRAIWDLCWNTSEVVDTEYADVHDDDLIHVNCMDYLENISYCDPSFPHSPISPLHLRERMIADRSAGNDDLGKCGCPNFHCGGHIGRNGGGGKVYIQNEFRSAHGASRNTSRAPSVHVDDFHSHA